MSLSMINLSCLHGDGRDCASFGTRIEVDPRESAPERYDWQTTISEAATLKDTHATCGNDSPLGTIGTQISAGWSASRSLRKGTWTVPSTSKSKGAFEAPNKGRRKTVRTPKATTTSSPIPTPGSMKGKSKNVYLSKTRPSPSMAPIPRVPTDFVASNCHEDSTARLHPKPPSRAGGRRPMACTKGKVRERTPTTGSLSVNMPSTPRGTCASCK
mmetsp:Transcript_34476/g.94919  ORF Transcript_34476/g.94919 Transcript_34476/m.94919 type:complete len:214 (-) Transcript_34476:287-928(-)